MYQTGVPDLMGAAAVSKAGLLKDAGWNIITVGAEIYGGLFSQQQYRDSLTSVASENNAQIYTGLTPIANDYNPVRTLVCAVANIPVPG